MTEKSKFYVTENAGDWVAGKRSPGKGKTIMLTKAQAQTPLRNGEISEEKPVAKPPKKPDEK